MVTSVYCVKNGRLNRDVIKSDQCVVWAVECVLDVVHIAPLPRPSPREMGNFVVEVHGAASRTAVQQQLNRLTCRLGW